jgi:hypothetical protein
MRSLAKYLGLLALAGTIIPPALFMFKLLPLVTMQWTMLAAAFVWFATAPVWMKGSD